MKNDPAPQPSRARSGRPSASQPKPKQDEAKKDKSKQDKPKEEKTARDHKFAPKRRGELSELAFVFKAASMGFPVAKPYGDSERYDFILDAGHRFWRVQVKSTTSMLHGFYHLNCHRSTSRGKVNYRPEEIDFLVAHIIPEDTWFILPVALIQDRTSVLFAPRGDPRGPGLFGAYAKPGTSCASPCRDGSLTRPAGQSSAPFG